MEGGEDGIVMTAKDCAHRNLFLRGRVGLEDNRQLITPCGERPVQSFDRSVQLGALVAFQVVLALVQSIDLA